MGRTDRLNRIPVWKAMPAAETDVAADRTSDVAIVGGGPVGLTLALDLGRHGHKVALLNRLNFIPAGSKAICFAKRTLDIWDRLGIGQAIVDRGVGWNVGRVFWGDRKDPLFSFDAQKHDRQRRPAFVNLPQYLVEEILVDALSELPNVSLLWAHDVLAVEQDAAGVTVEIATPGGLCRHRARWLAACDGARSPVRHMLGLDFPGRVFEDHFLITDIEVADDRPAERWFWFDPPFNPGQSALCHKQPGRVWRLDFQLGREIDRDCWSRPERIDQLVRAMLGPDCAFRQVWSSIYSFQCRRMERFVHDRVLFAGDSAHLVSPFGARGCNGGVADANNLGWKLDLVLRGAAPHGLLESYNDEATVTADANILASSRSTDFMTPKSGMSRVLRDAVLQLAVDHPCARPMVDSGRLSAAVAYPVSRLSTPDETGSHWRGVAPGSAAIDAPTAGGWLLERIGGGTFTLLSFQCDLPAELSDLRHVRLEDLGDPAGRVTARYDLSPGSAYLFRPDQYVAARWRAPCAVGIEAALDRARGAAWR
jgi:3-(3-hydroxy-phenyl)propionate hydroxylase